jgi:selenocysteine lyase/cysteine desulfurase
MEMAAVGMDMIAGWGTQATAARLAELTMRLADGLHDGNLSVADARVRAPHILCLGFRDGMPKGLVERLAAEKIFVASRLGRLRISPHVYNDEGDVDRFLETLHKLMPSL